MDGQFRPPHYSAFSGQMRAAHLCGMSSVSENTFEPMRQVKYRARSSPIYEGLQLFQKSMRFQLGVTNSNVITWVGGSGSKAGPEGAG